METQLQYQVDSYRFLDRAVKKMVRSWIRMETPREIPWTPLKKSLSESTVALVSSAGLALKTDQPFDQDGGWVKLLRKEVSKLMCALRTQYLDKVWFEKKFHA